MRYSRNSKPYRDLATWLKSRRIDQGMTIRDLAERLEVHHSIVGKIETGARKLDALELVEYCFALNENPEDAVAIIVKSIDWFQD